MVKKITKSNKKQSAAREVISSIPNGYHSILTQTIGKIKAAQTRAMVAVNRELIDLYLDIGKTISEQQETAEWGDSIVEQFAKDLQNSFPGMRGFSSRNLWNMKDLYLAYFKNKKLQTLSAEISWSHNIAILEKCKDILEREFYMRMSKKYSWSYRILLNQISSKAYERTITSQTNFEKSLPAKIQPEAKMAVKDEYAFGFFGCRR